MGNRFENLENRVFKKMDQAAGFVGKYGRRMVVATSLSAAIAGGGVSAIETIRGIELNGAIDNAQTSQLAEQLRHEQSDDFTIAWGALVVGTMGAYLGLNAYLGGKGYLFWYGSPAPIGRKNEDGSIDLYQEGIRLPGPQKDEIK